MTARLFAVTAWLATGHAVIFALFWLLLSVPESNAGMLTASALAAFVIALAFGLVEAGGMIGWEAGVPVREIPRRALKALPGAWLGGLLFVILWNAVSAAGWYWQGHRGEIDAWLMAQFGWAETAKLHEAVRLLLASLAWVVGLSLSLSLASTVMRGGAREAGRAAWLREALSPRRLLLLTAILVVFLWLPWQAVDWRPAWLSPNWQETVFVVVKLGVLFLIANVGWALALGTTRTGSVSGRKR